MHVIWKRPDGFQNALPEDFRRVSLSNGAHLWLHRHELDWYPFQVSGDWSGERDTKRLNHLVNMLDASETAWKSFLEHSLDDELGQKAEASLAHIAKEHVEWLEHLNQSIKGQTWEVEIIRCALQDVCQKIRCYC